MTKKTRHNYVSAVLFLGLVLLLSLTPLLNTTVIQAQGPDTPRKSGGDSSTGLPVFSNGERMDPSQNARPVGQVTTYTDIESFRYRDAGAINVIVELDEAPAALYAGAGAGGVSGQIARVESAQNAALGAMGAQGIDYTVLGTTELVLSSMLVRVDGSALGAIKSLPGVKHAYVERIGEYDNSTSVPFVNAPAAWSAGYTGAGMRVGVIDSGIDYDHVNFGGNGDGVPDAGEFPTAKIAGGYDFVGNSWAPGSAPVPDDDPYDQNGHGSHVAGTVAGFGVQSGATYVGAYDATTPFGSMTIGPGVAPEATLYSLKVGSSSNYVSEYAAIEALEWAMDPDGNGNLSDHLDAVNMSIGGDFGDPTYGWAAAADLASLAGVVVVSSAGNAGDTYFVQGDPSTANWAIAVAASSDGSLGFEIPQGQPLSGIYEANGASFGPSVYDVNGTLELADDGTDTVTDGCEALVGFTAGNVALIDRGSCSFTTKVYNAQMAGAIGVLVANTSTGTWTGLGAADGDPLAPLITIPSMLIRYADGQSIRASLPLGVHLSNAIVYGATADHLAEFSSRGPQRRVTDPLNAALKPDIAAPGASITSTGLGTGNGALTIGGTSMASPHVAGTVALLRQQHSAWTVDEIKALVMNTATHYVTDGVDNYDPARVGTGRLDVANASTSEVIAYNTADPELVNLSWGIQEVTASTPTAQAKTITVENKNPTDAASFDVSYVSLSDIPGVTFSVLPGNLSVPAGGTAVVTVTMNINLAAMVAPHTHANTVSEYQGGFARFWLSESSGLVQLDVVRGPATDLWVAVYGAARPASELQATTDPLPVAAMTGFTTIDMAGADVFTGVGFPYDVVSQVTAFELYDESPNDSEAAYSLPDEANSGDMEYIGVTSDYNANVALGGDLYNNTRVYFGISTYGDWASLSEETWFEVYIDHDQDGFADYVMYNWNLGAAAGGDSSDVFIPILQDLNTNDIYWYGDYVNFYEPDLLDTAPFQSRALFFGTWAGAFGLTDADPTFDFWVASWYKSELVDLSNLLTYNPTAQAVDFSGGWTGAPIWDDWAGASVPLDYDWSVYEGPNPPCVLLLHHHNIDALKAEAICLQVSVTHDVGVTITVDQPLPEEGTGVTFTITAINNVLTDPVGAILGVALPAGLTYGGNTVSQGAYNDVTNEWTIGVLPAGGTATMTIGAQVDPGTAGSTLTTTATIAGTVGTDTNPADNTASVGVDPLGEGQWEPGDGEGAGDTGDVTVLPSTGYPPAEDSQSTTNWLPVGLAGALALTLAAVGLVLRRRKHA